MLLSNDLWLRLLLLLLLLLLLQREHRLIVRHAIRRLSNPILLTHLRHPIRRPLHRWAARILLIGRLLRKAYVIPI